MSHKLFRAPVLLIGRDAYVEHIKSGENEPYCYWKIYYYYLLMDILRVSNDIIIWCLLLRQVTRLTYSIRSARTGRPTFGLCYRRSEHRL